MIQHNIKIARYCVETALNLLLFDCYKIAIFLQQYLILRTQTKIEKSCWVEKLLGDAIGGIDRELHPKHEKARSLASFNRPYV